MARKLNTKESAEAQKMLDKGQSRSKYPWNEWTDGNTWELIPEQDFDVPVKQFRVMLYGIGKRRSLKASFVKNDKGGYFLRFSQIAPTGTSEPVEKPDTKEG